MNCRGCREELNMAYYLQRKGLNIDFTSTDGHIFLIAFNDKGEILVE